MEDGENDEKHKVNPVMEAVLLCLHGLSRSKMNNEEKIQVCGKVFESFSSFSKENHEEINTNEVQAWQGDESLLHEDKGHEESSENEVEKVSNEDPAAEKISKETIISMLFKAVKDEVLQLKDVQTTIQGLLTRSHEGDVEIGEMGNNFIHAMNESNSLPFGAEMATEKRKGEDSLKGDEVHQGPSVLNQAAINRIAVSKGATATRQREPCPSIGSPCNKIFNHVNQQKQISFSPFPADGHASLVPNVNLAHTMFPEIVKQGTKGNSHASQQLLSEVKDKFSLSSFSDMLKLGLNAFNLEKAPTTLSDSNFQKEISSHNDFPTTAKEGERNNTNSPSSLLNVLPTSATFIMHKDGHKLKKDGAPLSYAEAISAKDHLKNSDSSRVHGQGSDMEEEGGSLVKVPSETLQRRLELCKLSVIGRVILGKGEEIWPTKRLRERLNEVWGFSSPWRLISLGKGYFHLLFSSQEELDKVWKRGVISLKPGVFRIQKFIFGFDPTKEKTTHAQVWFRFFHLPWCLWDSSILAALARKIGAPIRFDNNTINGDFGHYARVLIEVDLSKSVKSVLHLDCGNNIFDIKVLPENIPLFCKACSNIGHSSMECRMLKKRGEVGHYQINNSGSKVDCEQQEKNNETSGKHMESLNLGQVVSAIEDRVENHRNQKKGRNFANQSLHDSAKGNNKDKGIEEMVSEIGNQPPSVSVLQGSKDIHTSNKFAALEENEDMETGIENNGIKDSCIDEAKCDDKVQKLPLSQGDTNHTLKGIRMWVEQEKRNTLQPVEDSGQIGEKGVEENPTPKTPKRWSDIQEEEEEKEAHEASPKAFSPKPTDILSFERNGELTEIFMSNGKIRFTPISDKSKN